ncbi:MAG: hypothetical protein M3Y60_05815 [Bacteroidota bacterium]|nr:hypothetical protein [Bacteroidota bacterium]
MKAKIIVLILALVTPAKHYAQRVINESIAVKSGETLSMHFDYPKLVRVSSWDGNEISIQGTVSINGGENDDAFILENNKSENVISVRSEIRDLKKLPQRITIVDEGKKIMFRDEAELRKYQAENGRTYQRMSWGPDIDIQLEVKVPRNMATNITSVYGMVEVQNFSGPLTVEAIYGGVDASLTEKSIGEITAETNYGQIYTNLDVAFTGDKVTSRDFYTFVSAKPGQGPHYSFESKYGNVYLRKTSTVSR